MKFIKKILIMVNGIVICYNGSYDMGFTSGTMSFGINLDHYIMITKIDEFIAKYHA